MNRLPQFTLPLLGAVIFSMGCGTSLQPDDLSEGEEALTELNGCRLDNAVKFDNGIRFDNGIDVSNGINLSSTAVLNGVTGPYIAPVAGSALDKWIRLSPTNNQLILKYLVQCALPSTTSVRLRWGGTTQVLAAGIANLGPGWKKGQMTVDEQEKVSACLLARVNAQGAHVTINMFGPYARFQSASAAEVSTYTLREASFFGNLFKATPEAHMISWMGGIDASATRACDVAGTGSCGVIKINTAGNATYSSVAVIGTAGKMDYRTNIKVPTSTRIFTNVITTWVAPQVSGQPCWGNVQCASNICTRSGSTLGYCR